MKKMMIAVFLVNAFQMNACELTSLLTKKKFTVGEDLSENMQELDANKNKKTKIKNHH